MSTNTPLRVSFLTIHTTLERSAVYWSGTKTNKHTWKVIERNRRRREKDSLSQHEAFLVEVKVRLIQKTFVTSTRKILLPCLFSGHILARVEASHFTRSPFFVVTSGRGYWVLSYGNVARTCSTDRSYIRSWAPVNVSSRFCRAHRHFHGLFFFSVGIRATFESLFSFPPQSRVLYSKINHRSYTDDRCTSRMFLDSYIVFRRTILVTVYYVHEDTMNCVKNRKCPFRVPAFLSTLTNPW